MWSWRALPLLASLLCIIIIIVIVFYYFYLLLLLLLLSQRLSALRPALLLKEPWKEFIGIQEALALHRPRLKAQDFWGLGFLDADDFLPPRAPFKEKEARVGEQIGAATEQRGQQRQPLPLTHCAGQLSWRRAM